eukprot:GHVR01160162.1.p1 GENE.GHVR01160162.1~~GHVR01160162.1.p1  ORF type:complete len:144 (+),score=5.47 GHVR01160162.1:185-616(+)
MSNVRFFNNSFILIDLESFQGFPRNEDSMYPFPRKRVCSVVWTLWQAIACVWCVSMNQRVYDVRDKCRKPLTLNEFNVFFRSEDCSLASYIYHFGVNEQSNKQSEEMMKYSMHIEDCLFPGGLASVVSNLKIDTTMRAWVGFE